MVHYEGWIAILLIWWF